jgi:hypothetical protein
MYEVFEDSRQAALNADLPVPNLGEEINGIGVPARDAGRPLPSGARRVGTSWQPQGIIVRRSGGIGSAALGSAKGTGYYVFMSFLVPAATGYIAARVLSLDKPWRGSVLGVAGALSLMAWVQLEKRT